MSKLPLEGVKVLDFTWVIAGPLITKCLADYGATVVRVESMARPCFLRVSGPFKDRVVGPDNTTYFAYFNPNKYSASLNLKKPVGLRTARKLADWADIIVDNYVPGKLAKLGLDYESVKKINPDIIMLSTSGQGQSGPMAGIPMTGMILVALTGFMFFSGWPGEESTQPFGPVNDFITPSFGVPAILAALRHRKLTGEGQSIDLSQLEAGIQFLAPGILDYTANDRQIGNVGNSSPDAAPHGVYPCADNRWCAIAVFSDNEWKSLCTALEHTEAADDPLFSTFPGRKRNEDELNKMVGQWTIKHTPEYIMLTLQRAGVQAGVVKNSRDVCEDPQLKARNHFWNMNHPVMEDCICFGEPSILSETPARLLRPSPCLGEHTEFVATEFLNMSGQELIELLSDES
ncbi:MAG: CoA transferase [Dehalococcoidia bacterium]|nr:CoA transferase [Dehalococcoidia bacterium]